MVSTPTLQDHLCLFVTGTTNEDGRNIYCLQAAWVLRQYIDDAGNRRKVEFHIRAPSEGGQDRNIYYCINHASVVVQQRVGELESQVGRLVEEVIALSGGPDQMTREQKLDLETISRGFENAYSVMSGLGASSQEDDESPLERLAKAFNRALLLARNAMANTQTLMAKALRDKAVTQISRLQAPEELTRAARAFSRKLYDLSLLWAGRDYRAAHKACRELLDEARDLLKQVETYEERKRQEREEKERIAAESRKAAEVLAEVRERIRQGRSRSPLARFRAATLAQETGAAQEKNVPEAPKSPSGETSRPPEPSPNGRAKLEVEAQPVGEAPAPA